MATILRVFVMHFHELPTLVVNLLPEPKRHLKTVNFLDIPGSPSGSSSDFKPV